MRTLLLLLCLAAPARAAEPAALTALSPDDVVRLALDAAPSIDGQEAVTRQAHRDARAGAVRFVPDVDFSASYTRLSEVETPPLNFGGMEIDNPFAPILDNYAFKTTVTWPVSDLFLSILPGWRALADTARLQEASLEVERNQVARTALESYYQLGQARAGLVVAADGVAVLEAHVAQLRDLESAGRVTRADVLSATAQLEEARAQHEQLIGQVAVAEAHLCSQLDLPPPLAVSLPTEPATVDTRSVEVLYDIAHEQRPEVRMLGSLIEVHRRAARAQVGAAMPHLSVVGHYEYANPNQRIVPPTAEYYDTWDATVALTWSPGDTIEQLNGASQSRTELIQAEADLVALERGLRVQVTQARADLEAASRRAAAAQLQLEAAEAAFSDQQDLLAAGMSTATEALQAEAAARRARHSLLDARVGEVMAQIALTYAVGDLIDDPSTERK